MDLDFWNFWNIPITLKLGQSHISGDAESRIPNDEAVDNDIAVLYINFTKYITATKLTSSLHQLPKLWNVNGLAVQRKESS